MSSSNEHLMPPQKPKLSPLEFRNTDLVSRLLAATPPYLYNMSLLPNTYFFSEMLRSLVQAKNEQNSRNHQLNMHPPLRRSRKRTWARAESTAPNAVPEAKSEQNHNEPWMLKSSKKAEENPLELTTAKSEEGKTHFAKNEQAYQEQMQQENSSNLVLPPPPPMWYPPIYPHAPPYGIDPLHFFIDLRVSGHIYDRKNQKEGAGSSSPTSTIVTPTKKEEDVEKSNEMVDMFKQRRHCSAFSVPNASKVVNLSESRMKFDVKSMGFDKGTNKTSTNYILNNITSIYKNLGEQQQEERVEKSKKAQDLKTLIGFELVVDYMDKKTENNAQDESNDSISEVESVGSPALEVVDVNDDNN